MKSNKKIKVDHLNKDNSIRIGLVLSGGGIRGVAHIGVIKALEEEGVFPSDISGTSAGAIVGALYAGGYSWSEILHFFKTIPIFHPTRFAYNKPGFIDSEKFIEEFEKFFPDDSFKSLVKPLFITATNVINGHLKFFNAGELIRPLLASATFPGVFSPMNIDGSFYIDGGTLNNFPVEPLKNNCNKIIGSYVNPMKRIEITDLKHSYNVLDRAYKIKAANESLLKFEQCDLIFSPEELCDFSTFDIGAIDVIFDIGYNEAKKVLKENRVFIR